MEKPSKETGDDARQVPLKNHKLSPTCMCVDSKGTSAFTASKDGSIIKWCLTTRKIVAKVSSLPKDKSSSKKSQQKHHTRHINCIAISSDDKFLATGGWDKLIRIWSPDDLSWIHTFTMHRQEVTALAFRKGHPTLYSGSADRSIMLWTLEEDDNRCFIEALYGHESTVTCMDALRRERILSAGGRDQSVRIWKIVEQAQTVFECKHESVDVVRYVDDKTFVTGGEDGTICVWTTQKRTPVFSLEAAHVTDKSREVSSVNGRFDQRGLSFWISALASHSFKVKQTQPRKRRKLDDDAEVPDEDEEDGSDNNDDDGESESGALALLASGSCSSEIKVWKLIKNGSNHELKLHQSIDCPGFVNDLSFVCDGRKLVAACGQEHKFGRWWKIKDSKNCVRVFEINK